MSTTIKTLNEGFNKRYFLNESMKKKLREDSYSAYYDYEENSELDKYYERLEKAAEYYGLYPEVNVQNDEGSVTFEDENNGYEVVYEIDVHDMDDILYELKTVTKLRSWLKSVIPNASQLRKKSQNAKKYAISRKRYDELKSGRISEQSYPFFIYDELKPWASFEKLVEIVSRSVEKNIDNPEVQKFIERFGWRDADHSSTFGYLNHWYWDREVPQVVLNPVNKWLLDHVPQELIEPEL